MDKHVAISWNVTMLWADVNTHAKQTVHKPLANSSQTKYTYMWTGLQTCTVPSTNSLYIVHRKLKFVGFLRKHKGN